jgi:hypothetical protein
LMTVRRSTVAPIMCFSLPVSLVVWFRFLSAALRDQLTADLPSPA